MFLYNTTSWRLNEKYKYYRLKCIFIKRLSIIFELHFLSHLWIAKDIKKEIIGWSFEVWGWRVNSLLFCQINWLYRVFTELRHKVKKNSGRKKYLTELKMNKLDFKTKHLSKLKKYFMKDKNLCLNEPFTLGAWNRQFSSKRGGNFRQLCVLRDLWSHF